MVEQGVIEIEKDGAHRRTRLAQRRGPRGGSSSPDPATMSARPYLNGSFAMSRQRLSRSGRSESPTGPL